jgi:hypothetical protein
MTQAEAYRELVVARAGGICAYCRLVEAASGVTFHIEHVLPRSQGGQTVLTNLALSCPGCNLAKANRTTGRDRTGAVQLIFNPRDFEPPFLGWHLHFVLDRDSGVIVPRTSVADATILTLNMNDHNRVFARRLQMRAGLIG